MRRLLETGQAKVSRDQLTSAILTGLRALHLQKQGLNLPGIDVRNAFTFLPHSVIHAALHRKGVDSAMRAYISTS